MAGPHVVQHGAPLPSCGLLPSPNPWSRGNAPASPVLSKLVDIPTRPRRPTASRTDVEVLSVLVNRARRWTVLRGSQDIGADGQSPPGALFQACCAR